MSIFRLTAKNYSDVAYVKGMLSDDEKTRQQVCRALYEHCRRYFDENYRGVFFVGEEQQDSIFHNAFVKLWENIEQGKLYVEDDVLMGKDGKPITCTLTTYLMAIAKRKYMEYVRDVRKAQRHKDLANAERMAIAVYESADTERIDVIADCIGHMSERCCQILTLFWYQEMTLDEIMKALPTFSSKDALKTEKYKCMERLRKAANDRYQQIKHGYETRLSRPY